MEAKLGYNTSFILPKLKIKLSENFAAREKELRNMVDSSVPVLDREDMLKRENNL